MLDAPVMLFQQLIISKNCNLFIEKFNTNYCIKKFIVKKNSGSNINQNSTM